MEKWQRSLYQPNLPLGADGTKVTASKAHITLSKEAAKEGMVLLAQQFQHLLPLQNRFFSYQKECLLYFYLFQMIMPSYFRIQQFQPHI